MKNLSADRYSINELWHKNLIAGMKHNIIITTISLEHTNYLGYSTSEIAYNKAGIIKERVPALIGEVDDDAMFAINERAKKMKSELRRIPGYFNEKVHENHVIFDCHALRNVELNTSSMYQARNANIAIEAVQLLNHDFPVSEEVIREGLKCKLLECRFDWLNENILIDGAHNPEAIRCLVDTIKLSVHKPIHVVFACFKDKHFSAMLNMLDEISEDITITTFDHPRAKTKDEYLLFLETYKFADNFVEKVKELRAEFPEDVILITGGLYFAGLAKRELSK